MSGALRARRDRFPGWGAGLAGMPRALIEMMIVGAGVFARSLLRLAAEVRNSSGVTGRYVSGLAVCPPGPLR